MTQKTDLFEIWKMGIPLSKAWFDFAPSAMRREYRSPEISQALPPKSGLDMLAQTGQSRSETDDVKRAGLNLWQDLERGMKRSELKAQMEGYVLEQIIGRHLIGVGYLAGADVNSDPVEIPIQFFEPRSIDWMRNSICAATHRFESVRICRRKIKLKYDRPKSKIPETKKPGRPSVIDPIRHVIRELKSEGALAQKIQKEKIGLVRDRARSLYRNMFPKTTQPSKGKIVEALKLEGE